MHLFLSWSGERSRTIALALRKWIPMVLQSVEPWMSDSDIDKGERWDSAIAEQLNQAVVGVVCLTPENINRPWILFEAGALAKLVTRTRVYTYLFDLQPRNLEPPLGLFQHTAATAEDTRKLLSSINGKLDKPLDADRFESLFKATCPEVQQLLDSIPPAMETLPPQRSVEDMVAELLDLSRGRNAGSTVDAVLDKLEFIELALFALSYRTAQGSPFEYLGYQLLARSNEMSSGRGRGRDLMLKEMWEMFNELAEKRQAANRSQTQSLANMLLGRTGSPDAKVDTSASGSGQSEEE